MPGSKRAAALQNRKPERRAFTLFDDERGHQMAHNARRWKQSLVRGYACFRGQTWVIVRAHLRPVSFADVPAQLCFAF